MSQEQEGHYAEFAPVKIAGHYVIGTDRTLRVAIHPRPRWIHRVMTRCLLGWVWEDNR
jgi:hypothetical protein